MARTSQKTMTNQTDNATVTTTTKVVDNDVIGKFYNGPFGIEYTGARYVSVFADPIEWSKDSAYEHMVVVLYQGASYVSKCYVPAGIDITDSNYWLKTYDFDAQVELYRREVKDVKDKIDIVVIDYQKNYDTVQSMKNDSDIENGMIVHTSGFHAIGDNGAAYYIITDNETANEKDIIQCQNGLVGKLIITDNLTPEMLGAYGDGKTNDTEIFSFFNNSNYLAISLNRNKTYMVDTFTINSQKYILGNGGTIKAISTNSPIVIDVETTNYYGFLKDVRIDCNNIAESGLRVLKNINAFRFYDLNIVNVIKYGIHADKGCGTFYNVTVRNNQKNNIQCIGAYITAPDGIFYNLMTINCKYGVYTTANVQLVNFHPWNSFTELMKESYGIYSESSVLMSNSYIDTCTTCFAGNGSGYFFVDNLLLFWSTEYFTDQTSTEPPVIFHQTDSTSKTPHILMNGIRVYQPKGKTDKRVSFTNDSNVTVWDEIQSHGIWEGVYNQPPIYNETPEITFKNEAVNNTADPVKRSNRTHIKLNFDITGVTLSTTYTAITTLPSGYRPKEQLDFPILIRQGTTFGKPYIGSCEIRTDGQVFINSDGSGDINNTYHAYINMEYNL